MKEHWRWWYRHTSFFEAYLMVVMAGWAINLSLTDVFNSNALYRVMGETANQGTWAAVLAGWLLFYGVVVWRQWNIGRVVTLLASTWFWTSVAVMLYKSTPVSTGVVAYGALALLSSAAALYNAKFVSLKRGG